MTPVKKGTKLQVEYDGYLVSDAKMKRMLDALAEFEALLEKLNK